MSEQYSGAQVYEKIQSTIGFLQKRVGVLERDTSTLEQEVANYRADIANSTKVLAEAYVRDLDLRKEPDRDRIKKLTGKDLTYVLEEHEKVERILQIKKVQLEGDRLYLMRESIATVPGNETSEEAFVDERLNQLVRLEGHSGYQELMKQGYTTVTVSIEGYQKFLDDFVLFWKFASSTYKPGLFGFKHRRLGALAEATAQDLGFSSYAEMEHGINGRAEQRWSIPLLLINPGLSVREVKAKVDVLVAQHADIEVKLADSDRELRNYAARELAEHCAVTRTENLNSGDITEVRTHLATLVQLYSDRDEKEEEIRRSKKEQSELTKKIMKLTELLESHPGLQQSSETISARVIDDLFASPSPDYKSLHDLDAMIKREFPTATTYRYQFRRERPGRQSREWQDTARRAGGVGKWTTWRKI